MIEFCVRGFQNFTEWLITFSEWGVAKKMSKKGKIKNGKYDHFVLKIDSQNTRVHAPKQKINHDLNI